jgi:putative copper resistance protein D
MSLLIDIFGFLAIMLRGVVVAAQSIALGGIGFLLLLALPLRGELGAVAPVILERTRRWIGLAAWAVVAIQAVRLAVATATLTETTGLSLAGLWGADYFIAGTLSIAAALVVAIASRSASRGATVVMVLGGAGLLLASALTSHAVARFEDQLALGLAGALHQLGAAIWIGGLPFFLFALARTEGTPGIAAVGRRYSLLSMGSVAAILAGGVAFGFGYFDSPEAVWGTAYGLMVSTKVLLFVGLLLFGLANFRLVERLRRDPATPAIRLRRFAEVEMGIGVTIFFAAASLTSLPPAIDLVQDRVTLTEIAARLVPQAPLLTSPEHADLAIPKLQAELDAKAAEARQQAPQAFVPGAGLPPPKTAEDIAWSEYNHHWAGLMVLAIGLLSLAERTGRAPWARHWPLLFLVLAFFLVIRSDPEVWPLGSIGILESMRDPEVVQHRIFMLLIIAFGLFEWGVRTGRLKRPGAALVFPLVTSVGGGFLLAHSHQLGNVKEELLIEYTHVPLALFGIAAGWARWLDLRLPGRGGRIAAWIWPLSFIAVGLSLLFYRETSVVL